MSPDQIAEHAARRVLDANEGNLSDSYRPDGDPLIEFGWELGVAFSYEDGLMQLVAAALKIDSDQRVGGA